MYNDNDNMFTLYADFEHGSVLNCRAPTLSWGGLRPLLSELTTVRATDWENDHEATLGRDGLLQSGNGIWAFSER